MLRSTERSRGTGPRATVLRTLPGPVGRGPVPRHAAVYRKLAGETRSDARMETSEGPRATVIETRAGARPPRYGNRGSRGCSGLTLLCRIVPCAIVGGIQKMLELFYRVNPECGIK